MGLGRLLGVLRASRTGTAKLPRVLEGPSIRILGYQASNTLRVVACTIRCGRSGGNAEHHGPESSESWNASSLPPLDSDRRTRLNRKSVSSKCCLDPARALVEPRHL